MYVYVHHYYTNESHNINNTVLYTKDEIKKIIQCYILRKK